MLLEVLNFKCTAEAFTAVGDSVVQISKYKKLCNKNCGLRTQVRQIAKVSMFHQQMSLDS